MAFLLKYLHPFTDSWDVFILLLLFIEFEVDVFAPVVQVCKRRSVVVDVRK